MTAILRFIGWGGLFFAFCLVVSAACNGLQIAITGRLLP